MHIDELERYWLIAVSITLGSFVAALIAGVFIFGVQLPSPVGRVNPTTLDTTEFANPGVRDMGDGKYQAHIVAQMWNFMPNEIRVPVGAEVTFNVTSKDISHGFYIEQHDVNLMLLPGQIAQATIRFNEEGEYHIICHEYCGPGHQNMFGVVIVEPATTAGVTN